jgi:hypothetical protein
MKQQQQNIQQEQAVEAKLAEVAPQDNRFVALGFVNVASAGVRSDTSQTNYGEAFVEAVKAGTEAYKQTDKYKQGALRDEVRGAQDARTRLFDLNRDMEESEIPFDQRDKYLVNALEKDIGNQSENSDFYVSAYIGDVNKGVAQMSNLAAINHEAELDNAERSTLKQLYETGRLDISTYTKKLSMIEGVKQANQDISTMLSTELTTASSSFAVATKTFQFKATGIKKQVGRDIATELKKSGETELAFLKDKTYTVEDAKGVVTKKAMTMQQYTDSRVAEKVKASGLVDPLIDAERAVEEATGARGSDGSILINLNTPAAIALKGAIRNMRATVASHALLNAIEKRGEPVAVREIPVGAQDEATARIEDKVSILTASVINGQPDPALLLQMERQMELDSPIVSKALVPYTANLNNILAKTLKEGDPAEVRQALSVISNQAGAFSDHPLLNQGVRVALSPQVKAGLILMKTGVDDAQLAEFVRLSSTTVTAKEYEEAGINLPYITEKLLNNSNADHLTLAEKTELSKIIGITIKAQGSESWLFTPLWGAGDRPSTDIIASLFPKAPPATVGFVQGASSYGFKKTPPLIRSLHFGATQVRAYDSSHQGSLNKGLSWHINNDPKVRNALIAVHSFTKDAGAGQLDEESAFYKKFKARHE